MLKIGYLNFWKSPELFIKEVLLESLTDYQLVDCTLTQADIVFISGFGNSNNWIGSPTIIYYTAENPVLRNTSLHYDYSISFYPDSETNLFLPYCLADALDTYNKFKNLHSPLALKTQFCTTIVSNPYVGDLASRRREVFEYLCENYKRVDSIGPAFNNTGFLLPRDMKESIDYHTLYKFNLCFENSTSTKTCKYITEKIMNAYTYHTVPIYMGSECVEDIFNPESFINCNGLTNQQILERVREIDSDYGLYNYMLNQHPFVQKNIDYQDMRRQRVREFMKMIIDKLDR